METIKVNKLEKRVSPLTVILNLFLFRVFFFLLFLLLPIQLGGSKTYVILIGTSMEPNFSKGDLVIVQKKDSYKIGEVVLYSDPFIKNIFHRIVDLDSKKNHTSR